MKLWFLEQLVKVKIAKHGEFATYNGNVEWIGFLSYKWVRKSHHKFAAGMRLKW